MEKTDTTDESTVVAPAPTEESRALAAQREAALEKALSEMIAAAFAEENMQKNITFSLPADDYEALRWHCAALGVSVSGFIRALIRDAVPELRRKYSEIERGAARKRRLAA